MTLTPQWLDELRSRVTLSTLVARTVKITKAGREYKGCCPFHNEKTPSFYVNDEKGFYHCFGCSAHGDAIRWMTDHRGLPFMDAVKELASEAGMEVPAADPQAHKRAKKQSSLHDVMAAAQEFFVRQLGSIEGTKARDYLSQRGIRAKTITEFGFGYAPDSRTAIRSALGQYDAEMLIEAGLLISVEDKEPYDRFRGRLMIPIRDRRGRVIAFGGRILGDGEPKYLNSPDTPLFDKGRTLYNLDKASPASRATDRVIVAEGYMDVIALAQAGFGDAVAPLGTALTEQQIAMLWRMVPKPILCFDGDAAGQKAAMRAALRALPSLQPGHSLQFVTLPEGQDPDDLIRKSGPRAIGELFERSEPLVERLWRAEVAAEPLSTPEDRAGLKQRLGAHLNSIADAEIRRHYADAFRERFDDLFAPKGRFAPRPQGQFAQRKGAGALKGWQSSIVPPPGHEAKAIGRHGADLLLQGILVALIRRPALISRHYESLSGLVPRDANQAKLLSAILDIGISKESLETEGLLTILGADLYNMAKQLLSGDGTAFAFNRGNTEGADDKAAPDGGLSEAIRLMKQRPALEASLEAATEAAGRDLTEASFAEQQRLRAEKEAFDRRLTELLQRDDVD